MFDFVRDALHRRGCPARRETRPSWRDFVARCSKLTGPVTAKGVEDTALPIAITRLVSLNEVGGDRPGSAGGGRVPRARTPGAPRTLAGDRSSPPRRTTPSAARTCGPGSTYCRRSRPTLAKARVRLWRRLARRFGGQAGRYPLARGTGEVPSLSDAGRCLARRRVGRGRPRFTERMQAYMEKAVRREGFARRGWINPDPDYDAANPAAFVKPASWLREAPSYRTCAPSRALVARHGVFQLALAQTVLKIASPGASRTSTPEQRSLGPRPSRTPTTAVRELRGRPGPARHANRRDRGRAPTGRRSAPGTSRAGATGRSQALHDRARPWRAARRPGLFMEGDYLPLMPRGRHTDTGPLFAAGMRAAP